MTIFAIVSFYIAAFNHMEIITLGTSSGVPSKQRNVSAAAIKRVNSKRWILVDCGEATQHQLLNCKLSIMGLDAICITHVHGDHCYGLPGLLASAAMSGRNQPLTLIAPAAIQTLLAALVETTQLQLSYAIEFIEVEDFEQGLSVAGFEIKRHPLSHRVPSYAYSFCETDIAAQLDVDKLRASGIPPSSIWGQLQKGEDVSLDDGRVLVAKDYLLAGRSPRKVIIAGDNDTPSLLKDACKGADVLVHESTYTSDTAKKIGFEPGHSNAADVAQFAEHVQLPHLILTHFSPRYGLNKNDSPSMQDIEQEARQFYHGQLFLAHDFDTFILDHQRCLSLSTK